MIHVFDLPKDALKRLQRLIPDEAIVTATDDALSTPSRQSRITPICVHRLIITAEQRRNIVEKMRKMLARDGFEENGAMLPIGHIYEGFLNTFSRENRIVA